MKQLHTLALYMISCLLCISCGKTNETKDFSTSKDLPKYFNYYPPKTVAVDESLLFDFTSDNHNPATMGRSTVDLITIEPQVEYQATWTSPTTLKVTPMAPLAFNKSYDVKVKLGSLFNKVPSYNEIAKFTLKTQKLNFIVAQPTIEYSNVVGDERIMVKGKMSYPIGFDTAIIIKSFHFAQENNKTIKVEWKLLSFKELEFQVSNIKRLEKDTSALRIVWNGSKFNPSFKGEYIIKIPKRDAFEVTSIKASDESDKKIEVYFSNIVKYNQVLDGLFTVKKFPVKFKTEIESNKVTLFPEEGLAQDIILQVNKNIIDKTSRTMQNNFSKAIHFAAPKPQVKDLRVGVIIPDGDKMFIPFQAKNLRYVDVSVRKIFQNNVIHFLRHNNLESNYHVRHVGRTVYKEKIDLHKYAKENNTNKFVSYSIDLKKMADRDPGCIYKINISYRPSYAKKRDCNLADRTNTDNEEGAEEHAENRYDEEEDYDYYDYSSDNEDPCSDDYYSGNRFIQKTIMLSNIGVIAKVHEKNLHIICSDINTAAPMSNAEITVYDQQKQAIIKQSTDSEGMVGFAKLQRAAKFIIVKKDKNYSYLDLGNQESNSMTEFDVEGINKSKNINAFTYTDRGVYRPGDSIFFNTIIVDEKKTLPQAHPIHIIVADAQGHIKFDKNTTQKKGNIYSCIIPTLYDDPTGNWTATVTVGNTSFNHTLKIETIKPNRLKIAYDTQDDILNISKGNTSTLNFKSRWLHGASAQQLKAEVDVKISAASTVFNVYKNYAFQDPMRSLEGSYERVFEGTLNDEGKAAYKVNLGDNDFAPGFVQLDIKTRVYEKSGNFSEDYLSTKASPYTSYVGIKVPRDRWDDYYVKTNSKISIPCIGLDKNGKKMPNRKLSIGLYSMHPSWWYEENEDNSLKYNTGEHMGSIEKREVTTNAKGEAYWEGAIRNSGYYLIRVCDVESGHCSGQKFYADGYQRMQNDKAKGILDFTADKKSYNNGELIKLRIPSNENSKILISLENASGLIKTLWVDGKQGYTNIDIPTTTAMHPNVYVHATMIQKYKDKNNDLPIRMYGVIPVKVLDPATVLQPIISMPASIEPDKEYTIIVKEKFNRPFTYTLAVVDEGLLDVTRFKTPDPHKYFFAKQALNVRTWDIYDQVASNFNGKIYKAISIGGDGSIDNAAMVKRAERFKPVVKFYGPFYSNGGLKNHKIKISNYVGSVRAMVVACNDKSFGNAEVSVPVKKPLMVQSTLPRIVYLGDEFTFSTNVFAMKKEIKKIEINVEATPNATFITSNKTIIALKEGSTDDIAEFKLKANKIGKCKISVVAKSGKVSTTEKVEIDIVNPNPTEFAEVKSTVDKSSKLEFETFGVQGSNKAVLELSNVLSFNFEKRLQYLIQYPYGCLEQTTSSVFPQLYVGKVIHLEEKQANQIPINVKGGIERLAGFQTYSGAFAYWPGQTEINTYANSYAGHFLLEAKANGYLVPDLLIKKWLDYQTTTSNNFADNNNYESHYDQAYRLYTLALANQPNKGAMNVLKLKQNLDEKTKNMLACAYALTDVKNTAVALFNQVSIKQMVSCNSFTFNSDLVELSIKSMAMEILKFDKQAIAINTNIIACLGSDRYYSTHGLALALMAIAKQKSNALSDGVIATYTYRGKSHKIQLKKAVTLIDLPLDYDVKQSVQVVNHLQRPLFAKITYSGSRPMKANTKNFADNMMMNVEYYSQDNKKIDATNLPQGKDFYAVIKIKKTNPTINYTNLALDYFIPAGWEIQNERVTGQADESIKNYDYQDIRDNVVYTFFNMNSKENETFKIKLTASYKGRFFLPATLCGAMYDNGIKGSNSGYWVTVGAAEEKEGVVCN